jgi:phosphoribosyl 1,2-cyclic phosphodiesterase
MDVKILASGSGGNLIAVRTSKTIFLVDAGEAKTRIEKLLLNSGFPPTEIKAIFITHGHIDHAYGVSFANKYKIPVYASEGSWREKKYMAKVDDNLRHVLRDGEVIRINDCKIAPFNTSHDDYEPLGYTFSDGELKASVCLDTGYVSNEMLHRMKGSNIYIIESNHEPNMVEVSDYPPATKARILSHIGHLSNEQTAEALSKLVVGVGEQIYLTHLSHKNNMPALAEMTVKRALTKKALRAGTHYKIEVV